MEKYIYQDTNKTNSGYTQPLGTPLFPGSTNTPLMQIEELPRSGTSQFKLWVWE